MSGFESAGQRARRIYGAATAELVIAAHYFGDEEAVQKLAAHGLRVDAEGNLIAITHEGESS